MHTHTHTHTHTHKQWSETEEKLYFVFWSKTVWFFPPRLHSHLAAVRLCNQSVLFCTCSIGFSFSLILVLRSLFCCVCVLMSWFQNTPISRTQTPTWEDHDPQNHRMFVFFCRQYDISLNNCPCCTKRDYTVKSEVCDHLQWVTWLGAILWVRSYSFLSCLHEPLISCDWAAPLPEINLLKE